MSILDRGPRGNIQNPFTTVDVGSIAYSNPRVTPSFNGNLEGVLNYILDAIYPNYKGTVPTPADLPNNAQVNDYYIVSDDGDGNSAGYVWSSIAGVDTWIKRYDVDWSYEQILADTVNRTSFLYAAKYGYTDKDAQGFEIGGIYGGQRIYGGEKATQNLTFTANIKDTSGFVQSDNTFRPTLDAVLDLGTDELRWENGFFAAGLYVGTLSINGGSIADATNAITFSNCSLSDIQTLSAAHVVSGTMELGDGSITDTSGAIDFGAANLSTTGTLEASTGSVLADITFTNGTITSASGLLSFSDANLQSIGILTSSKVVTDEVDVQNLVLSGQTLKTNADATALILQAGTGGNSTTVQINSALQANFDVTVSGTLTVNGSSIHTFTGPIQVGTALKISTATGNAKLESLTGDVQVVSFSGTIKTTGDLLPSVSATYTLGSSANRFKDLFLSGTINDGSHSIDMTALMSLRDVATGAANGYSLLYDGVTGTWKPSAISITADHLLLTNLTTGDAGHTQFAMLNGRSGGQTIYGGTAASENLTLGSTTHATKGSVLVLQTLSPNTDATYSGGWQGLDLGSASRNFRDLYSKGIHYGLRIDQYAGSGAYPTNSGTAVGRIIWDTTLNKLLVDTGSSWSSVGGAQKFSSDTTWDGSTTTKTVDVSASISDARTAIWQLCDNTNSFERMFVKITCTQTIVTITVSPALPAGSYRLIGLN